MKVRVHLRHIASGVLLDNYPSSVQHVASALHTAPKDIIATKLSETKKGSQKQVVDAFQFKYANAIVEFDIPDDVVILKMMGNKTKYSHIKNDIFFTQVAWKRCNELIKSQTLSMICVCKTTNNSWKSKPLYESMDKLVQDLSETFVKEQYMTGVYFVCTKLTHVPTRGQLDLSVVENILATLWTDHKVIHGDFARRNLMKMTDGTIVPTDFGNAINADNVTRKTLWYRWKLQITNDDDTMEALQALMTSDETWQGFLEAALGKNRPKAFISDRLLSESTYELLFPSRRIYQFNQQQYTVSALRNVYGQLSEAAIRFFKLNNSKLVLVNEPGYMMELLRRYEKICVFLCAIDAGPDIKVQIQKNT
tara:strand:+ start:40 stop:1134 length:1095 start_codon:yes stop_codon:yes gene_type:complete